VSIEKNTFAFGLAATIFLKVLYLLGTAKLFSCHFLFAVGQIPESKWFSEFWKGLSGNTFCSRYFTAE